MAVGLTSPDVGNLSVGKGFILFKPQGATDFYHVGNVPTFTFTPKIETLDHFSSMEGTRTKDLSITIEKSGEIKMDMEEVTATNLAMLVLGDVTVNDETGETEVAIFSRDSLKGELRYYATNEVGPRWYVQLLSVTFNPSGDFSPISEEFTVLPVTGTVASVDGVFGKMTLKQPIGAVIPENVLVPSISGMTGGDPPGSAPKVGDVLSANVGGWVGVDEFAYLWKAAGSAPSGTPANEKTYTVVTGDIGDAFTVEVTGSNDIGPAAAAVSAATAPAVA